MKYLQNESAVAVHMTAEEVPVQFAEVNPFIETEESRQVF